jgi:hypothetical protein
VVRSKGMMSLMGTLALYFKGARHSHAVKSVLIPLAYPKLLNRSKTLVYGGGVGL